MDGAITELTAANVRRLAGIKTRRHERAQATFDACRRAADAAIEAVQAAEAERDRAMVSRDTGRTHLLAEVAGKPLALPVFQLLQRRLDALDEAVADANSEIENRRTMLAARRVDLDSAAVALTAARAAARKADHIRTHCEERVAASAAMLTEIETEDASKPFSADE